MRFNPLKSRSDSANEITMILKKLATTLKLVESEFSTRNLEISLVVSTSENMYRNMTSLLALSGWPGNTFTSKNSRK